MKKLIIASFLLILLASCSSSVEIEESQYVDKEIVLKEAKTFEPNPKVEWSAEIVENKEVVIGSNTFEKRTVWEVVGLYPAGNKLIINFDAESGEGLSISEVEHSK